MQMATEEEAKAVLACRSAVNDLTDFLIEKCGDKVAMSGFLLAVIDKFSKEALIDAFDAYDRIMRTRMHDC